MKICRNCGHENSDHARFCRNCGTRFEDGTAGAPRPAPPQPKKKRPWLLPLIILIIATVLIIAAGILVLVKSGIFSRDRMETEEYEAYCRPLTEEDVAEEDGVYYADSQLLLTASENASFDDIEKLAAEYGGEIVGYISVTDDYQILFEDGMSYQELESTAEELNDSRLVETATISYVAEVSMDSVDYAKDPWIDGYDAEDLSGQEWNIQNPSGKNWWAEAVNMPTVWNMDFDTETVKAGIIDSVFDTTNEDIDENVFAKTWNNPADEEGNCSVTELYSQAYQHLTDIAGSGDEDAIEAAAAECTTYSHGTHVAGLIAAQGGNGFGITGVSQNAELYGYAMGSDEAAETQASRWSDVFEVKYAMSLMLNEGTKVINISMGFSNALKGAQHGDKAYEKFVDTNSILMEDFLKKYIDAGYDFLICKSAGNDSTSQETFDASYDYLGAITDEEVAERIIIVGAAEYDSGEGTFRRVSFSNGGDRVDVYAPGVDVLSDMPTNITSVKSGTSMATPIVSGLATLIWGINPDLSPEQVKMIIETSTWANFLSPEERPWISEWAENVADFAQIVNAYTCVDMALSIAGTEDAAAHELGTVTGVIYSKSGEDSYANLDVTSVAVYNENGDKVSETDPAEIGLHEEDEGTYILPCYTLLLEAGNYTLEVGGDNFNTQTREITVEANEVNIVDIEIPASEIIHEADQLAGEVVSGTDGTVYYWKYGPDSFEDSAAGAQFQPVVGAVNQLTARDPEGNETVVLETAGDGKLLLEGNRIFYERTVDDMSGSAVCSYDMDTGEQKDWGEGKLQAGAGNRVICSDNTYSRIDVIDPETGERSELVSGRFLTADGESIYYQPPESDAEAAGKGRVTLAVIQAGGSGQKNLYTTEPDLYPDDDFMGDAVITFMVIKENDIYFSYGSYSGSSVSFSGGKIVRVSKDGSSGEVVAGNDGLQDAIFTVNDDGAVTGTSIESGGSIYIEPMDRYYTKDGEIGFFNEENGNPEILISRSDYASAGSEPCGQMGGESALSVRYAVRVGDDVYFMLDHAVMDTENFSGWRTSYIHDRSTMLKKNLTSGEVQSIYEYQAGN